MRACYLALLLAAPGWAVGNLCLSQTGGSYNWSDPSAWTNCNGAAPGDGDFVVWRSTGILTLDVDVGSVAGGGIKIIRIENGTFALTPGITITFGSTCGGTATCDAAAIAGSGTTTNPGADATMSGLFLARTSGAISTGGSAGSRVTFKVADGVSRFYIFSAWGARTGCTEFSANVCNGRATYIDFPSLVISYADFYQFGSVAKPGMVLTSYGNSPAFAATHGFDHCRFYSPYGVVYSGASNFANLGITFTYNTIYYPQYSKDIQAAARPSPAIIATDNTEIVRDTGVAGALISLTYVPTGTFLVARNAIQNTATTQRSFEAYAANTSSGGVAATAENNLSVTPEVSSSIGPCGNVSGIWRRNICQGTRAIGLYLPNNAGGTTTASGNWTSQWKAQWPGQGNYITYGWAVSGGDYSVDHEIMLIENADDANHPMGLLAYAGNGTYQSQSTHIDRVTLKMPFYAGGGLAIGEGGFPMAKSAVRNSIVTGGAYINSFAQIAGWSTSSWDPSWAFNGASVHHNATYAAGAMGPYNSNNTAGYTNGVLRHPNAIYGDVDGVDPRFLDASRRPCQYSLLLGGDGSCDDLFARLATRALGANGCAVCETYSDGGYGATNDHIIEAIRKWLFHGFTPLEQRLWCAGHDGESIGAISMCAKGKAMLGAVAQ